MKVAGYFLPLLMFADDIVLARRDPKRTQDLLDSLSGWGNLSGLTVNAEKTFTLVGGVV